MSDPNPAEAATRMMQDMWKAFMPSSGTPGAAGATANPFAPTPEMVRGMQNAFFSAMEENAERMMRTPQFLDAMQKSMTESLAMQQQLRTFLQSNLEQSMPGGAASPGGPGSADAGPAIVAALQRIERSLDQIGERLDTVEQAVAAAPAAGMSTTSKSARARKGSA